MSQRQSEDQKGCASHNSRENQRQCASQRQREHPTRNCEPLKMRVPVLLSAAIVRASNRRLERAIDRMSTIDPARAIRNERTTTGKRATTIERTIGRVRPHNSLLPGRAYFEKADAGFTREGIRTSAILGFAVPGALASARRGYAVSVDLVSAAINSAASAALQRTSRRTRLSRERQRWDNTNVTGMTRILLSSPDGMQLGPRTVSGDGAQLSHRIKVSPKQEQQPPALRRPFRRRVAIT